MLGDDDNAERYYKNALKINREHVEAKHNLSLLLDKEDPIPNEYYLEVASSGRERVFNDKQDYLNNLNKYILVDKCV